MHAARVQVSDETFLYIEAVSADRPAEEGERELAGIPGITSVQGAIEDVTDALGYFVEQLRDAFGRANATKCVVEFGCDVAIETGKVVAVIGKGNATSSLKVTMEWERPKD